MKIGFTGTGRGMTPEQMDLLRLTLSEANEVTEFHHGDCVGADAEADQIARDYGIPIHIHPPADPKARAFCAQPGDTVYPERPYLDRNHDIVDATDRLVAAPRSRKEILRSGTWATMRYAQKRGDRVIVTLPPSDAGASSR